MTRPSLDMLDSEGFTYAGSCSETSGISASRRRGRLKSSITTTDGRVTDDETRHSLGPHSRASDARLLTRVLGRAAQEGSPEELVAKAMDAVNHGRINEFVKVLDPDSLEEARKSIVDSVDEGVKRVGEAKVLQSFPGVKSEGPQGARRAATLRWRTRENKLRPKHEEIARRDQDRCLRPRR